MSQEVYVKGVLFFKPTPKMQQRVKTRLVLNLSTISKWVKEYEEYVYKDRFGDDCLKMDIISGKHGYSALAVNMNKDEL